MPLKVACGVWTPASNILKQQHRNAEGFVADRAPAACSAVEVHLRVMGPVVLLVAEGKIEHSQNTGCCVTSVTTNKKQSAAVAG